MSHPVTEAAQNAEENGAAGTQSGTVDGTLNTEGTSL